MAEKKKASAEVETTETTNKTEPTDVIEATAAEVTETPEAATASAQEEKPASDASGFCVYIGPTIQGLIQSGTVYGGTKQQALKQLELAIQQYPLIARLIVPGDTLAADRIKVKNPGNQLYAFYRRLASTKKTV